MDNLAQSCIPTPFLYITYGKKLIYFNIKVHKKRQKTLPAIHRNENSFLCLYFFCFFISRISAADFNLFFPSEAFIFYNSFKMWFSYLTMTAANQNTIMCVFSLLYLQSYFIIPRQTRGQDFCPVLH